MKLPVTRVGFSGGILLSGENLLEMQMGWCPVGKDSGQRCLLYITPPSHSRFLTIHELLEDHYTAVSLVSVHEVSNSNMLLNLVSEFLSVLNIISIVA